MTKSGAGRKEREQEEGKEPGQGKRHIYYHTHYNELSSEINKAKFLVGGAEGLIHLMRVRWTEGRSETEVPSEYTSLTPSCVSTE